MTHIYYTTTAMRKTRNGDEDKTSLNLFYLLRFIIAFFTQQKQQNAFFSLNITKHKCLMWFIILYIYHHHSYMVFDDSSTVVIRFSATICEQHPLVNRKRSKSVVCANLSKILDFILQVRILSYVCIQKQGQSKP